MTVFDRHFFTRRFCAIAQIFVNSVFALATWILKKKCRQIFEQLFYVYVRSWIGARIPIGRLIQPGIQTTFFVASIRIRINRIEQFAIIIIIINCTLFRPPGRNNVIILPCVCLAARDDSFECGCECGRFFWGINTFWCGRCGRLWSPIGAPAYSLYLRAFFFTSRESLR
jgi:hypothetical protein